MEESKSKRTGDSNRHVLGSKKKVVQEKKTRSDTTTISSGSSQDQSLESILVVGKSCNFVKSKSHESGYRLHECHSETAIYPLKDPQLLKEVVPTEGLEGIPSNASFVSAKSNISDTGQRRIQDLEDKLSYQNETIRSLRLQLEDKVLVEHASASTETDLSLSELEDNILKLKDLEKKLTQKEKKVKELNQKVNEYLKANEEQVEENKGLTHQVHHLTRQLQSMYELVGQKPWSRSVDVDELIKSKNKVTELETLVGQLKEEKSSLNRKVRELSACVEAKDVEVTAKNREFLEYKNRSTLEMCKLLYQIDCLREDAKAQSLLIDSKISEVQNSMDDEIVSITQRLEEQYQKDIKSAIDKFQSDFERLADLPKTVIEKLLTFCEPDKIDVLAFQKEWDSRQKTLETKIESMQVNHKREIQQLKDSYDTKIIFLKTQVESLSSQLKERKEILDIFESELSMYKSSSSMNLLMASSLGDDISSLKELYTAEIFSQKQVHKLQISIFEEKVKTLSEEILYHAKNEEIRIQELENAKRMAFAFREKYEQLVSDWQERVDKDFQVDSPQAVNTSELEGMFEEFKNLIQALKKSEESQEEKLKKIELDREDEMCSYLRDIEVFKNRLLQLEQFQKAQAKLDLTIQDLIKTLGCNYARTVEALLTSHVTELSLKELEMCSSEKRHLGEMEAVKNKHEKELEELMKKLKYVEDAKAVLELELESKKVTKEEELMSLKVKIEEMSLALLKSQGTIAVKEETEQLLNDRIKELEKTIKKKDENCRKELEELVGKFLEVKILSAAKDELARELEDRLNKSEKLLEKSFAELDRLFSALDGSTGTENFYPNDGGDFRNQAEVCDKVSNVRTNGEQLRMKLLEAFELLEEKSENLRKSEISKRDKQLEEDLIITVEKNKMLEEERNQILDENNTLKVENQKLEEEIAKKKKMLEEMPSTAPDTEEDQREREVTILKAEKEENLRRKAEEEKEEILKRNELLQENIRDLNERIDLLMAELANGKGSDDGEMFSISVQEVRVLYQEEEDESVCGLERAPSTSTFGCQVEILGEDSSELLNDLWRTNEDLKKENESLRNELRDKDAEGVDNSGMSFHEEVLLKCQNIEKKLGEVMNERNELEKERDELKLALGNLREENDVMRTSCEAKMKLLEKSSGSGEDSSLAECKVKEMNKEIGKLSEYIKTLSSKLDLMKTSNEILLSESHEHLKQNQNLVNELEEAWSQRYEIEDQLAKVRRENALLNLHRSQLEETNRRISNLVAEGKPSVVSWIKIHETVENIVDEVLALKTSFSDSGSLSVGSTGLDVPKSPEDMKMMTETLHAQLKNKTILCDELMLQKETLERELKGLENLLKENDTRILGQKKFVRKRQLDQPPNRHQSACCPLEKRPALEWSVLHRNPEPSRVEGSPMMTLNRLKRQLEDQVEREEAHFRENLKLEIKGLQKEMVSGEKTRKDEEKEKHLASIESRYEEEVQELTREFEREVDRLREVYGQGNLEEKSWAENRDREIDKLKSYFEKKWADLEKRYRDIYSAQQQKRLNPEQSQILNRLQDILQGEENLETKAKVESLLREIIKRHNNEMKELRQKNEEILRMLEKKHGSEVQKLQTVVLELKENIEAALRKEQDKERKEEILEEVEKKHKTLLESIREEYEEKLEEEKKKLNDLLEETKQTHEKEMIAMEEFWTEKLSECETKCAIMRATEERKKKKTSHGEREESFSRQRESGKTEKDCLEENQEKQIERYRRESQGFESDTESAIKRAEENFCVSCLSDQTYRGIMEVKTDDDKLEVAQELDAYRDIVTSLRFIVTKLLSYIGQNRGELSSISLKGSDYDDTMYRSIQIDLDRSTGANSSNFLFSLDLSTIIQEINENSFLNSSDQVRFELDRCLKQLKKEATGLLALSCPESTGPSLPELIKKMEKEKGELEMKVSKVEEIQEEMKKEISMTKERLSQWERNLEVVSEGYGEEVVEPKKLVSVSELKEKIKLFMAEQPSQELNLLEEIWKEGDRLQEEWKREKFDLQQQIDVADKQVHSLKKFLEEQAAEREQEREAFDREIGLLKENLKSKERDNSLQNRTNREVEALEGQVKDLTGQLSEVEKNKAAVEAEFQNAVKKIWSLREVIQDLEVQLAEVSERELNLKKKVEKLEGLVDEESRANRELREELEAIREENEVKYTEHIRSLEEEMMSLRRVADQVNPESLSQLKFSLRELETILIKKTKDLEQLHVSSANVSCSSPSEDVSIRDHLDATRCSTPDEMSLNPQPASIVLPLEEVDRVHERLARHTRAEEVAMKFIQDLKMQLRNNRKAFEEVQTERDVLLERVDSYLKENSSLKVRLEEQRCNAGLLQRQLNANLESQISRLEVDVEKLNELCNEKDKQLRDMKVILENTTKSLKIRETEALNKSREESALVISLKTDLANALNDNEKLEEKLNKMKEKLRESMTMPALIDTMLEEKNAEIDRLEKEVTRLSSEGDSKNKKRIKFSEPDSFGDCISSISHHNPSDLRNCSDSYADFKNSSFKIRRPYQCSTKLESLSSIGPLQLSPRGTDSSFSWKFSSPIPPREDGVKSPPKSPPNKSDFERMVQDSKLREEMESKQRQISELQLETDILKRQLVEVNQELVNAKSQTKEIQDGLTSKEEEIRKLRNNEKSLLMTVESLKKNHAEEVEELQNKLSFEHEKVEKVYEEIKALEVKKIEIEEAFLSLKEDYNEKISGERKAAEALLERIKILEVKNKESEEKLEVMEKDMKTAIRDSEQMVQTLTKEISDLKTREKSDAQVQAEGDVCVCQKNLALQMPKVEGPLDSNLNELKEKYEKMAETLCEMNFRKSDAFAYAMTVKNLLSCVLNNVEELMKELESHRKKVMECSVDDLAFKVQRELVLSAKLDNQLLSSIEANGFASKESALELTETSLRELGGAGDATFVSPKPSSNNENVLKLTSLYKEMARKVTSLETERDVLEEKISEQQKVIKLLEESLSKEKERIFEERERCVEDAKLMELLRVNLEKGLQDIKFKDKDLKKERQARAALEKEIKTYRKQGVAERERKRVAELSSQLEIQKEKLASLEQQVEEEKRKNQELRLSLEENRIERMSEKSAQRLMESDLALVREQKENLKIELLNARKLLNSRNTEIGLLKRKLNLQEIDLKALSLSKDFLLHPSPSDTSSDMINKTGSLDDIGLSDGRIPSSLLSKMRRLNNCVQHHVRESNEMGETLLYLSQETEQMKNLIRKLEENGEGRASEEVFVEDLDVERKLWALEKGRLVMDVEELRGEFENLKRDLVETCKSNELLKLENCKLKKESKLLTEDVTSQLENGFLQDRVAHLTRKYMRAESYRKALAWQKNYLLISLKDYQRSEDEAWRKMGKGTRKRETKGRGQARGGRFRVVALAVLAVFRMQYIVRRWQKNALSYAYCLMDSQKQKLAPLASVLNIYNEPVNPLSYQTQNIFRRPSSKVLRTPPSRDPGLRSYSLDSAKVSTCLETFACLQETARALP